MTIEAIKETHLEQLARRVERAVTHRELTSILLRCGLDGDVEGSKWYRITVALSSQQRQHGCGNHTAAFLMAVLDPARFVGRTAEFSDLLAQVNQILAFSGLQMGEDGQLRVTGAARTLSDAEARASRLRAELIRRQVHPDVVRFCRPELLQHDFFHAILEATKSVADKLRNRTGLTMDGAALVDRALGGQQPLLALNSLQTESERSEQTGLGSLARGMFSTFRNVTAHEPRITRAYTEQDAVDLLTLVSYLHRQIDRAVWTPYAP